MLDVKEAPKTKTTEAVGQKKEMVRQATMPRPVFPGPFAFMGGLAGELDRVFEDFGLETDWFMPRLLRRVERRLGREEVPAGWVPRIEAFEREGQFILRAELPGMTAEDVKVEVAHNHITLEGERKQEKKEEREGYYYGECRYGAFHRVIPLPKGVDTAKAHAEFGKGVLEIVMPRTTPPEEVVRRLKVQEAS